MNNMSAMKYFGIFEMNNLGESTLLNYIQLESIPIPVMSLLMKTIKDRPEFFEPKPKIQSETEVHTPVESEVHAPEVHTPVESEVHAPVESEVPEVCKIILKPIRSKSKTQKSVIDFKRYLQYATTWKDSRHNTGKVGDYFGFVVNDDHVVYCKIIDKKFNLLTIDVKEEHKGSWTTFKKINNKKDNWKLIDTTRTDFFAKKIFNEWN